MLFDKSTLLGFLEEVDKELKRSITLVAAGGTAMTLLGVKPSTIDIDFTIPDKDYDEFESALNIIPHGFRVDHWKDGMVFSQVLPEDYMEKAIAIKTHLKNITLKALNPVDIVVTKIGRLDERDIQDIEACIKEFKLTRRQVSERASQVHYIGNEENYKVNLRHVLERFFHK